MEASSGTVVHERRLVTVADTSARVWENPAAFPASKELQRRHGCSNRSENRRLTPYPPAVLRGNWSHSTNDDTQKTTKAPSSSSAAGSLHQAPFAIIRTSLRVRQRVVRGEQHYCAVPKGPFTTQQQGTRLVPGPRLASIKKRCDKARAIEKQRRRLHHGHTKRQGPSHHTGKRRERVELKRLCACVRARTCVPRYIPRAVQIDVVDGGRIPVGARASARDINATGK